jgi:hypothetical protein
VIAFSVSYSGVLRARWCVFWRNACPMGENVFKPAAAGTASEHSSQTGRPSPETVQQPTPSRAVRKRLRSAACPPCSSGRAPRHLTTATIVRNFEEKYQGTPQVKNGFPSLQLASKCGRSSPARSPVRSRSLRATNAAWISPVFLTSDLVRAAVEGKPNLAKHPAGNSYLGSSC